MIDLSEKPQGTCIMINLSENTQGTWIMIILSEKPQGTKEHELWLIYQKCNRIFTEIYQNL